MNLEENKVKDKLFLDGLNCFRSSKYYDAHEYWEELWSDYYLKDAKFIQALIQLSVGYFHITNNNKNGALGLLKKCKPKFEMFKPACRGIDVLYILKCIDKSLICLNEIEEMKMFNWQLVPKIEIDGTRTI